MALMFVLQCNVMYNIALHTQGHFRYHSNTNNELDERGAFFQRRYSTYFVYRYYSSRRDCDMYRNITKMLLHPYDRYRRFIGPRDQRFVNDGSLYI